MESEIIKMAISQGIWAVLFISLFFYVLKTNSEREAKYQTIIEKLTDTLKEIPGIKEAVYAIKKHLKID